MKAYIVGDVKGCLYCDLFTGVRCFPVNKKPEYKDVQTDKLPEWCPLQNVSIEQGDYYGKR